MSFMSFFGKNKKTTEPPLAERIAKWLVSPDPNKMTYQEVKVATRRADFVNNTPGVRDLLTGMLDFASKPQDKKTMQEATILFNDFERVAKITLDQQAQKEFDDEILKTLKSKENTSSVKMDPKMEELYARFKDVFGRESVAEISHKNPLKF